MRRICSSLLMLLFLVGCQTEAYQKYGLYDRSQRYLDSDLIEPLKVPAEVESIQSNDRYAIPAVQSVDLSVPPVSIVPPGLDLGDAQG